MSVDRCTHARAIIEVQFTGEATERLYPPLPDAEAPDGIYTVTGRTVSHERAREIIQLARRALDDAGFTLLSAEVKALPDAGGAVEITFNVDVSEIRSL